MSALAAYADVIMLHRYRPEPRSRPMASCSGDSSHGVYSKGEGQGDDGETKPEKCAAGACRAVECGCQPPALAMILARARVVLV